LHKSSSIKLKSGKWINNERLEFLGDAILDAIVADIVFKQFEYKKEGFLTNIRSKIVQRDTLNKLAVEIGLDKLIKTSTRNLSHNTHMYGNALEALIGAIYLDQGYRVAKKFVDERLIQEFLDMDRVARKEVNFKSRMIEWSQKNKIEIQFNLIESFTDNYNNPVFQSEVVIGDVQVGIGSGYSKKESQQNAAKMAMKKLKSDPQFAESLIESNSNLKKSPDETALDPEEQPFSEEENLQENKE
jgi:ribonuclease III